MAQIYEKLEKEENTVRYMVLVLLGAGINFAVGFGVMFSGVTALFLAPIQVLTSPLPAYASILVTSYFVIGIIYSTIVSLAFRPKRIVSPLYTQVVTSAFVAILIMLVLVTTPTIPPTDLITGTVEVLFFTLVSLGLFFLAGIGQTIVVKYLVGLNGTKEDTSSFGLVINGKLEDVLRVIKSHDFQEALSLDRSEERKTGEHSRVFRTPRFAKKQLFIAVVADSQDNNKTQFVTVSYIQAYHGIMKTETLTEEARNHAIKVAFKKAGMKFAVDNTDSLARFMAYDHGLGVTESRLLTLRSLPPYSRAIGLGLVVMAVLVSLLWRGNYITSDMFESFWIFAGLAILFDLLPLLRPKHTSKSELG